MYDLIFLIRYLKTPNLIFIIRIITSVFKIGGHNPGYPYFYSSSKSYSSTFLPSSFASSNAFSNVFISNAFVSFA